MKSTTLALIRKSWSDGQVMLLASCLILFLFGWVFVILTKDINLGALLTFLESFNTDWKKLMVVSPREMATPTGLIGFLFVHPVVMLTCITWGVARGSDAVSGELGAGTLEVVLAQPVSRTQVLITQATITVLGAGLLALALVGGMALGLKTCTLKEPPDIAVYYWAATNLFAITVLTSGIATCCSAFDRYRWRSIGTMGVLLVVETIIKLASRSWSQGEWLQYFSLLTWYEPQLLIGPPDNHWQLALRFDAILLVGGLLGYLAAWLQFLRRDLPAPL